MVRKTIKALRSYKDLSLGQLRAFCEVCRLGGYAAAGRELLLSGPTVWEQLRGLEAQFEVRLFERHGNRVRPTLHGQQLLELVRPILASLDTTKSLLHLRDGLLPRHVDILTNLRVLEAEISRAMFQFQKRYPTIELSVSYVGGEEVEPLIVCGETEVVLTLQPSDDQVLRTSSLVFEPAGQLDFLLVTPANHPLMRKRSFSLANVVKHRLVLGRLSRQTRERVHEVFQRHNLNRDVKIAVQTSSDQYIPTCVRAGLGVGIAMGKTTSPMYHDLGVRSLRPWFGTAQVGFMWRKGAHVPPLYRELAELIQAEIAD